MDVTIANSTEGWILNISPVFLISLHLFHFLVALPLNTYIIVLIFPRKEGMEAADVFTLNQAIAEITFIFIGPFQCLCSISSEWCFLKPLGFMIGMSICSQGVFQCFVCLERYMAVVHPLIFLKLKPIRYRIGCCIFGWIIALALGIHSMLTIPLMPYSMYAALYVAMLVLHVFCCMSILKKLRHPGPADRERGDKEMNNFKKKAFQVVSLNLLAFLILVIPMAVSMSLQDDLSVNEFNLITTIGMAICNTLGIVQPIFVLHRVGKLSGMPYLTCCKF